MCVFVPASVRVCTPVCVCVWKPAVLMSDSRRNRVNYGESWEINDSTLPSHLLSNLWPSGCSSNLLLVSPHLLRLLPILFFLVLDALIFIPYTLFPLLSSESHPSDFPPQTSPLCLPPLVSPLIFPSGFPASPSCSCFFHSPPRVRWTPA